MEFNKRSIKLFAISGKARSGKDTVSRVIKDYYSDKNCIIISYGHYIKDYVKRISNWDGSEDTKPRELLQQIGIELIKNKINNKLFINRILEDIEVFSYFYDIIVVDDVRLIDEMESLKEKYSDIITIRVIRNDYDNGLTLSEKNHITEIGLDNYSKFDYVVSNDEKLEENIISILRSV